MSAHLLVKTFVPCYKLRDKAIGHQCVSCSVVTAVISFVTLWGR